MAALARCNRIVVPNRLPSLAERLRGLADAARRRRRAEPGSEQHDDALADMIRLQREMNVDARPPSWDQDDEEGGAVSTAPSWKSQADSEASERR
jgi:hypothetical protein